MHDSPLMQVRHSPQEGYKHSAHGLLLAHAAPEATQLIKEIAAGRVLHDQVYARLVFKGAIQVDNIGMLNLNVNLDLPLNLAHVQYAKLALFVDLQSNRYGGLAAEGMIDHRGGTGTNLFHQRVILQCPGLEAAHLRWAEGRHRNHAGNTWRLRWRLTLHMLWAVGIAQGRPWHWVRLWRACVVQAMRGRHMLLHWGAVCRHRMSMCQRGHVLER
mmetsp:Transcript_31959/g.82779  ORF Transcript_31959/g.82779 Transcript_31959/m.82779 type:complete len:215 (-) Transcript_31959:154-798(-)